VVFQDRSVYTVYTYNDLEYYWSTQGTITMAKCQFCNREGTPQQIGGHRSHCKDNPNRTMTSEVQSRLRYNQMSYEEGMADDLRKDGWEIFSPTVVCDRIGIKDGKVVLIEFKKPGQELRESQQRVHDVDPDSYLIVYKDTKGL
jgi:hypothetical protein